MKAELDAAKIWEENWGPLFAPDEPHNYEDRIKKLEDEAAKCVTRERGRARLLLCLRSRDAPSLTRAHPRTRAHLPLARPQDQGRPLVTAIGGVRRLGACVPRVRAAALEGHEDEDGDRGQDGRGRRQLHGPRQIRCRVVET